MTQEEETKVTTLALQCTGCDHQFITIRFALEHQRTTEDVMCRHGGFNPIEVSE